MSSKDLIDLLNSAILYHDAHLVGIMVVSALCSGLLLKYASKQHMPAGFWGYVCTAVVWMIITLPFVMFLYLFFFLGWIGVVSTLESVIHWRF